MSDEQIAQRSLSTGRNVKKLRAISRVCSLTGSWQRWASDNQAELAAEPTGWCPASLGGRQQEPKKTSVPESPPQTPQAFGIHDVARASGQASRTEEVNAPDEPPESTRIKSVPAVKTASSSARETGAGAGRLTETIQKETLPAGDETDEVLGKRSSPSRRRKCSNMVSSLTRSWKQVENENGGGGGVESVPSDEDEDVKDRPTQSLTKELDRRQCEDEPEVAATIKRPSALVYNKGAEDANKINALSMKHSAVGSLRTRWQDWASEHSLNQRLNPFSEYFDHDYSMSLRLQKGQDGYGRPKAGTKTAERAERAERHIHREIDDMCYVIRTMAGRDADGRTRVTFGQLFDRYVRISDKVVGILVRARKHGKVAFEGEMLWQGRDDGVIITLLV